MYFIMVNLSLKDLLRLFTAFLFIVLATFGVAIIVIKAGFIEIATNMAAIAGILSAIFAFYTILNTSEKQPVKTTQTQQSDQDYTTPPPPGKPPEDLTKKRTCATNGGRRQLEQITESNPNQQNTEDSPMGHRKHPYTTLPHRNHSLQLSSNRASTLYSVPTTIPQHLHHTSLMARKHSPLSTYRNRSICQLLPILTLIYPDIPSNLVLWYTTNDWMPWLWSTLFYELQEKLLERRKPKYNH